MSEPQPDAATHEGDRLRGPHRLLLWGPVVALLVAFATSAVGADGRAGLVLFLLLLAVVFAVVGIWVGGALLLDEFRGAPTSRRRGLLTIGMFAAALVCMTAVSGVVGGGR